MNLLHHIFAFDPNSPLLFTQFYFWAFFAIVYALFAVIAPVRKEQNSRIHLRNAYLFLVSLFFYYKTSGIFLLILCFVTLSDFFIAQRIHKRKTEGRIARAKAWLIMSCIIDLGLLCYFKYAYFLTNMVNDLLGTQLQVFDLFAYVGNGFSETGRFMVDRIVLPVGISFYIFQVISYSADVFMGKIRPVKNLLDFGFYVSFFPQLVAGPIVRASEFIPQLYKPFRLSRRWLGIAVFWILNGLAKKIILSDYLAVNFIDRVFENPLLFSGFENLMALFTYSLQVYADFSGYTDIAIGIAMLMGFYLPKNFNSPYKSFNPQEFWRRWHMSLSRWLKSYLYIPLGGNRTASFGTWFWIALFALIGTILSGSWIVGASIAAIALIVAIVIWRRADKRKKIFANLNSFITMLLGGLWHGASWNFLIWGGLNGIGMIVYKMWKDMSWTLRMLLLTAVLGGLLTLRHFYPAPAWNLFAVWVGIIWAAALIRSLWHAIAKKNTLSQEGVFVQKMANVWAIAQTFTFITFTRLFFRSGSNLDPATANHEAWETAQNMVAQIGGAWNLETVPDICAAYWEVFTLFVLGMIIHWLPERWKQWYRINFALLPIPLMIILAVAIVFVLYQFITADLQAFIYFQF